MKKVPVIQFKQKGYDFYLLAYDPREIIKFIDFPDPGKTQDTQRPWDEKRVHEIALYVAGLINLDLSKLKDNKKKKATGLIPNCPILNIHGGIKIIKENEGTFILLPENEDEHKKYRKSIECLDGQHRLISFHEDYLNGNFKSHEAYSMGYVVCENLTQDEKTEIFIFTNEKQKTVDKNVLRQLMKWLGLLSDDDEDLYDLVVKLHKESYSPLMGRISIGGHRIKHGFKILQVIKIFEKSKTISVLTNNKINKIDQVKHFKIISDYLKAWETVFPGKYNHPAHTLGKISGLRYVMCLFPSITEILKHQKKKTQIDNLVPIVSYLKNSVLTDKFFENNEKNPNQLDLLSFRGETSTMSLSDRHGDMLKAHFITSNAEFDPNS